MGEGVHGAALVQELKPNPASLTRFAERLTKLFHERAPEFSDSSFRQLAAELWALQLQHNAAFRAWRHGRGTELGAAFRLDEIPALPASAWKEFDVTSIPPEERTTVFHSSGTTGQRPSRHFHQRASLALYEQAALAGFRLRFPDVAPPPAFWSLTPDPAETPHSSLAHMLGCFHRELGNAESRFFGVASANGWEVEVEALLRCLGEASQLGGSIILAGTAFNFVHALDHPGFRAAPTPLPPGSRIIETGGYKGRSRELSREDLHASLAAQFGVPRSAIVTEYGMSELSSQAYSVLNADGAFRLRFPPWARALVVSPDSGREVALGAVGVVRVLDLANVWSAFALQTADVAIRHADGFELLGRRPEAEARGCSLLAVP